jgi:hypothetical protein
MTLAPALEPAGAPAGGRRLTLPEPRGPWTERLYALLHAPHSPLPGLDELPEAVDPLGDDDLQLALYVCYELHYAGIEGVDEQLEWNPAVLAFRSIMEAELERGLRKLVDAPSGDPAGCVSVGAELQRLVREDDGPPLSRFVETQATLDQVLEHVVHRSAYQLKEADPHSWAIPRLSGGPKAALVEIQSDEYGAGRAERMHATLFAQTMRELGLDPHYGAYVGLLPGITLATVNLMSWFGLHRRLRGAVAGHLAAFEMTSSVPNRRYGNGLRRLGFGRRVTEFYDEHVEADAVHESIAAWDLAGALATDEPALAEDILFGARALLALEARWGAFLLSRWRARQTSLLGSLPLVVA